VVVDPPDDSPSVPGVPVEDSAVPEDVESPLAVGSLDVDVDPLVEEVDGIVLAEPVEVSPVVSPADPSSAGHATSKRRKRM
jgi:hypothetical protein